MEKARLESQWNQTALVCCQIANVLVTRKADLVKPEVFNPFAATRKAPQRPRDTVKASDVGRMLDRYGWRGEAPRRQRPN